MLCASIRKESTYQALRESLLKPLVAPTAQTNQDNFYTVDMHEGK